MGTEIVFVLIYPVALICVPAAIWFWFAVVKAEQPTTLFGYIRGSFPLFVGFSVSMAGLAYYAYINCYAEFTYLIQRGYYAESQRAVYLPARIIGQTIVNLVLGLPAICLVVIPTTAKLVRTNRLTLSRIGFLTVMAWIALSLMGWLWSLGTFVPPYMLLDLLKSTAVPVLIYALPIPIAALLL
jgi:hypothetical protein